MSITCLNRKVQFVLLAMEGPDLYSMVGGLGVRVTELSRCLAELGYTTHLFFVGDPNLPAVEVSGNLTLHRLCQRISASYPSGVYEGERAKMHEFESYWPAQVVEEIVRPGVEQGLVTVFLTEDWQTVQATINLGEELRRQYLAQRALILWNANNSYGFSEIDWHRLESCAVITAVSRYMKHDMWRLQTNPVVVRNGIPQRELLPVPQDMTDALRLQFPGLLLAKVGRYSEDKRWIMAIEAIAELKKRGLRPRIIVRGGKEQHRYEVQERARALGLVWQEVSSPANKSVTGIVDALAACPPADVYELCFYVPEDFIRVLYAGADFVLANSGHEPFGLVGLEVMACGGLAFVGATGEDYASNLVNCISIETSDPLEMAVYIEALLSQRDVMAEIRRNGRHNAEAFTWDKVAMDLFMKINFLALKRGVQLS